MGVVTTGLELLAALSAFLTPSKLDSLEDFFVEVVAAFASIFDGAADDADDAAAEVDDDTEATLGGGDEASEETERGDESGTEGDGDGDGNGDGDGDGDGGASLCLREAQWKNRNIDTYLIQTSSIAFG